MDAIIDLPLTNQDKARTVHSGLKAAAGGGDRQAERIIDAMSQRGILRTVHDRSRIQTGVIVDTGSGRQINVPIGANVPVRDDDGVDEATR